MTSEIKKAFENITPLTHGTNTAYLIWKDPYMAAGGDTFINDMLCRCGFTNIFQHINRYPEVSIKNSSIGDTAASYDVHLSSINHCASNINALTTDNCQLLLLSSEPYPFKQKHLDELQTLLPSTKIILVDGEAFSWYGSRLLYSTRYFNGLIRKFKGNTYI